MDGLVVSGWGVLAPDGAGQTAGFAPEMLPGVGVAVADFDIRRSLGRKGTSAFDRNTGMAVVACGQALADSGLDVGEHNRRRIGVVLGTTVGSFKSTSEYSQETLEQDRPYLVNPMLFPNTVMNRAAGQAAIWYGLKGVNATVAGGPLAFFNALRYASNALRRGYADTVLTGAVEEFSAHAAWAHHLTSGARTGVPPGEGAAVLVVERAADVRAAGRSRDAEILSVATGFRPRSRPAVEAVADCVRRALHRAGVTAAEIRLVVTADGDGDDVCRLAAGAALGGEVAGTGPGGGAVEHASIAATYGQCQAAGGAFQAAAALARHRADPARDGRLALLVAHCPTGGVAASVLRGWSRVGAGGR